MVAFDWWQDECVEPLAAEAALSLSGGAVQLQEPAAPCDAPCCSVTTTLPSFADRPSFGGYPSLQRLTYQEWASQRRPVRLPPGLPRPPLHRSGEQPQLRESLLGDLDELDDECDEWFASLVSSGTCSGWLAEELGDELRPAPPASAQEQAVEAAQPACSDGGSTHAELLCTAAPTYFGALHRPLRVNVHGAGACDSDRTVVSPMGSVDSDAECDAAPEQEGSKSSRSSSTDSLRSWDTCCTGTEDEDMAEQDCCEEELGSGGPECGGKAGATAPSVQGATCTATAPGPLAEGRHAQVLCGWHACVGLWAGPVDPSDAGASNEPCGWPFWQEQHVQRLLAEAVCEALWGHGLEDEGAAGADFRAQENF